MILSTYKIYYDQPNKNKTKNARRNKMSKRDYLEHLKSNCTSIGKGKTLIPVFVERVKMPNKSNPKSPYLLFCRAMVKKPTLVKFEIKKDDKGNIIKRVKTEEEIRQYGDEEDEEGVMVDVDQELMVSCFDKVSCSKLSDADVVDVSCTASIYIKKLEDGTVDRRISYKSDKVTFKKEFSSLQKSVYEKSIVGTKIAEIPTPLNLQESDFPEGVDEKYMSRRFVAPLSSDQTSFKSVIPVFDDNENSMVSYVKDTVNNVVIPYVGMSMVEGSSSVNSIGVVFQNHPTEEDPDPTPIMLKLSFTPAFWTCFGIDDVDLWKPVAKRIVSNMKEAYFFAYTNISGLKSLKSNVEYYDEDGNVEEMDDDETKPKFVNTTAFGTKLRVDLFATIKACGIPIGHDYVEQIMEDRRYTREYQPFGSDEHSRPKHPLNSGFRTKLDGGVKSIFNVSEISSEDIDKFFKSAKPKYNQLTYYGVFASDEPYEQDMEDITEFVSENNITPNIIFAILE